MPHRKRTEKLEYRWLRETERSIHEFIKLKKDFDHKKALFQQQQKHVRQKYDHLIAKAREKHKPKGSVKMWM